MKRIISLFLCVLTLFSLCITPVMASDVIGGVDAPMAEDVSVSAYAAFVMDMETGEVLYDHDAYEHNSPASTTKIMTAYLCLKYGDPDDMVTVKSSAFSDLNERASTGGLVVGEEMTVYRLLQALLVVSASEAANVVAEYICDTREEFVELMNEEASALGCENTNFVNCHGLPRSEHYTCARDLAIIANAAMKYDVFREIVGSAKTTMAATNKHTEQRITSTNGLLPGSSNPLYNYENAIGVKTGHTSVAGYCLVSAANTDDQEIMCVVMGCGTREASFAQSIKLFDWAYENYEILTWEAPDGNKPNLAEVPEAPEYEDLPESLQEEESSLMEEEASLLEADASLLEAEVSLAETPAPVESSVPTSAPEAAPETSPEASPEASPEVTPETQDKSALLTTMMPVVLCFAVALLLLLTLLIVLIVLLCKRSREKKRKKNRKR